jgi:hypothetical protein
MVFFKSIILILVVYSWLSINHSCRDDIKPTSKREENGVRMVPDQVSYYFQLAQQHQQSLQNGGAQANPTQVTHASTES